MLGIYIKRSGASHLSACIAWQSGGGQCVLPPDIERQAPVRVTMSILRDFVPAIQAFPTAGIEVDVLQWSYFRQ